MSVKRKKLCSAPILAYPIFDTNCPFSVKTDTSDTGLRVVLAQVQDGVERVIAYGSRKMNKAEQNYGVSEREALAMVYGVSHFRPYLYGQKFKITDHKLLGCMNNICHVVVH